MKFKIMCKDVGTSSALKVGMVYNAITVPGDPSSYVVEICGPLGQLTQITYPKDLFDVVVEAASSPTKIFVECIDDRGWGNYITNGKIYELIKQSPSSSGKINYTVLGDNRRPVDLFSTRFRIVQNNKTNIAKAILSSGIDVVEERCWAAMRPYIAPGNCVCGCHKSRCDYHRDQP